MSTALRLRLLSLCTALCLGLLGGCATTGAGDPRDPLEPVNRAIYSFNDGLDTVIIKPAAEVYQAVLPSPVRTGVSNVFSNLNDIIVMLNNLLQGKFIPALSDLSRVMFNTTIGLLGVFDVATDLGIEKNNEDFGQTLGYWGFGDGPYLVLPILGPSSLRDAVGRFGDYKTDPVTYIDPSRDRNVVQGTRAVVKRAELLTASKVLQTAAIDEYQFVRDAYLQRRLNLIHDGNPPRDRDQRSDAAPEPRGVNLRSSTELSFPQAGETVLTSGQPTPAEEAALQLREMQESAAARGTEPRAAVFRVWLPNPQ